MTVWAKTCIVCTKTEFNFIVTVYRHTQYLFNPSRPSVYQMLNVNWSVSWRAFCQPSKIMTGTMASMEDANWVGLFPLPLWPTNVAWAIVWVSWLLWHILTGFFATSHPTPPPISFHPFCKLYWHHKRHGKNIIKFTHRWFRRLYQQITKYCTT